MITIQSKFSQAPQSICEYQASRDGRYGWLLCTLHQEQDHQLEEIQAEIKLEIMNSGVQNISKMEIENWLKTYFNDLHWKLHARFRKSELQEKGISLLFAVIYDCEVYFVQFGRLFAAIARGKKKLEAVGKHWKNYHVGSLSELGLLGCLEEDIKVRTQHLHLAENESLIILPGHIAGKVLENLEENSSLRPLIESYSGMPGSLWMILKNMPQLVKAKKRRLTKLEVSSIILLGATFLAVLYMAFGNRLLDVLFHRVRKEVIAGPIKEVRQNLIEDVGSVVNSPARRIELAVEWSAPMDYEITAVPVFDLKNIYLASHDDLVAYSKNTHGQLWQKAFAQKIVSVLPNDAGIAVCLESSQTVCLDAQGKELWSRDLATSCERAAQNPLCEITYEDDKRINRSIMVVSGDQAISVVDSRNGEQMSELKLKEKLRYLSAYDDLDSCFYAVMGNWLLCLRLKIVN
ncbi:MAG TPA: PQQ-binding-like beta-propeller repeat protein [Candidatus Syntrophosphaera sp.]|nr:PQQ-binding-like beta-propeller repeat protein [Candidatus Syntrophosphaera sp.]